MAAYKRSDPTKLAKEREAIRQSQREFEQSPADSAAEAQDKALDKKGYTGSPNESTFHLIGRVISKKIQQNKERAEGYGGRPVLNGAQVLPGRRKRTVRDTSA